MIKSKKMMLGAMVMSMAIPAVVVPVSANDDSVKETNYVSDFEYKVEADGTITILIGKVSTSKHVVFPDEIDGKKVTGIDKKNHPSGTITGMYKNLETVVFPKDLKRIGDDLFYDSVNLKEVILPEGLEVISPGAFGKAKITTLVLPSTLKELGYGAFSSVMLEELIIPDNLKTISAGAFSTGNPSDKTYVKKLILGKNLEVIDSNSFAESKVEEIDFSRNEKLTTIEDYAFSGHNMESIILPNTVIKIGDEAFKSKLGDTKNRKLESINIPESVKSIGEQAFYGHMIKKITDEKGNIIGDGKTLEIPKGITEIGKGTFRANSPINGELIEKVIIPDSVTKIGASAFNGNSIKEIEIPSSVTSAPSSILNENQFVPEFLTIWGQPGSRAHAIAIEKGYKFNEGQMPKPEPEQPEKPSEPSEQPNWSFDNPNAPYLGGTPTVSVIGGKSVQSINLLDFKWVSEETTVETEHGNIILTPTESGTQVSIPDGLGDSATDEELKVEFEGQHFMTIKIIPQPKIEFEFGL